MTLDNKFTLCNTILMRKNDRYESKSDLTIGISTLFINKGELGTRDQALMSEPSLRMVDT